MMEKLHSIFALPRSNQLLMRKTRLDRKPRCSLYHVSSPDQKSPNEIKIQPEIESGSPDRKGFINIPHYDPCLHTEQIRGLGISAWHSNPSENPNETKNKNPASLAPRIRIGVDATKRRTKGKLEWLQFRNNLNDLIFRRTSVLKREVEGEEERPWQGLTRGRDWPRKREGCKCNFWITKTIGNAFGKWRIIHWLYPVMVSR